MKNLIIFLLFLLSSCSIFPKEAPTIYVSNLSPNIIKNISIKFPKKTLNLPQLNPGLTQGGSFIINDSKDFFGIVKVEWNNLYNENIIRNFNLKENDLPSFFNPKDFGYVQIYIKDYDIQIITYDTPDSGNKTAQMDIILKDLNVYYNVEKKSPVRGSLLSIDYIPR
jgi:hypothetical protein